ncbi:unnamed protein product [Bursaphelenchus okinawaensis]|uniref:Translation initiation factor eIF2B subunit delta n=1 Tax=Bursaphelenchus okinawaensis TaxID=465554 RepID=A0A811KT22_9BILA|nr:unnamed protein product [Bursaphelenchus okinawaensis]CAG9110639.1 unnamed protein product [Bursaphelenchus okinawaensis]
MGQKKNKNEAKKANEQPKKENEQQKKINDQQKKANEQPKKENEQQKKVNDQQKKVNEQTKKVNESPKKVNEQAKQQKKEGKKNNKDVPDAPRKNVQPEKVPGDSSDKPPNPPSPISRPYPFLLSDEKNMHPVFGRLKAQSSAGDLYGIESVILEFLNCLAQFINEFNGEAKTKSYRDSLLQNLQPQLSCLTENGHKHFPLALGNVIRQFKKFAGLLSEDITSDEFRDQAKEWLDDFYKANFTQATQAIVDFTIEKIYGLSATSLLTFGWSPVVERILLVLTDKTSDNWDVGVVDSVPNGKALPLAKELSSRGIRCTYGLLNAVAEMTRTAHLVLLGGTAVLSNGSVLAPRGAGLVALAARARNIPVLMTVKSYQFIDKVRTMEKHNQNALDSEPLELIPADLITALVTEIRILPPTSAPAVLKAKQLISA